LARSSSGWTSSHAAAGQVAATSARCCSLRPTPACTGVPETRPCRPPQEGTALAPPHVGSGSAERAADDALAIALGYINPGGRVGIDLGGACAGIVACRGAVIGAGLGDAVALLGGEGRRRLGGGDARQQDGGRDGGGDGVRFDLSAPWTGPTGMGPTKHNSAPR